jgi:hypothetical protein
MVTLQVSAALTTAALGSIPISQIGVHGGQALGAWWAHPLAPGRSGTLLDFMMRIASPHAGAQRSVRAIARVDDRTEIATIGVK